jgi:hypothetical protein
MCSFYTGTQSEVLFANGFAYPIANASSSAAQNLMAAASGKNQQPLFPGGFFQQGRAGQVAAVDFAIIMSGQASATTATITAGLNTNSGTISGSSTLVASSAFTMTSYASGSVMGRIIISCFGAGYGTGATGTETNLWSSISMTAFGNSLATTATGGPTNLTSIDFSLNQWLSLAVTFSTASASNTATLQQIFVSGLN